MAQCYMRCPSSADEWIMVEMQGELTSHEHTSFQNLTLGTLRVQDDGVPHLEIGNHMLEGKFENLKKPLLVCQRRPLDLSLLVAHKLPTPMSSWDRPSENVSMNSAFDANTSRMSDAPLPPPSYDQNDYSSPSAIKFRAPVFDPPPSFDVDSAVQAASASSPPESLNVPRAEYSRAFPGSFRRPGAAAAARDDVRSIIAYARRSTPNRIARFEFKLCNGESLFAPRMVENEQDLGPAGQWNLFDGESLACTYVLADLRGASPATWLFETSSRRMSIVFGPPSGNVRVCAFECGREELSIVGVEQLLISGSGDSSGALPPVSKVGAHDYQRHLRALSSLLSVDIETDLNGVNKIAFVHQPGRSSENNESYGFHVSGSSVESFHLQDAGTVHAEFVAEVVCVQDSQRLHAIQFASSRGRRSDWILRGEWRAFRSSQLARMLDDVGDELEREARALALALDDALETVASTVSSDAKDFAVDAQSEPSLRNSLTLDFEYEAPVHNNRRSFFDCNYGDGRGKLFAGCFAYIFGVVIVGLFAYGCTATTYMYSYGTTLGVWLGVFLPCVVICGCVGFAMIDGGADGGPVIAFCAGTWVVGLLVGLIGGIYYLGPWWMLTHLDTAYNVDAAALDFINNRTQPTSGIFHFQPSAFVNQARYGYSFVNSKSGGSTYFCAAPIVSTLTQARVVYWVTGSGGCCSSTGSSCWNSASSPGSVDGAYLQVRRPEYINSVYSDARVGACAQLAAINSTYSAASICSFPTVYLTLASSPETTRDSLYKKGMTYVGIMTALWPLVLGIVPLVVLLVSWAYQ